MSKPAEKPQLRESILQTDVWGSFRESLGWHAHKIDNILVLERPLPLGKSFLYAPEVTVKPDKLLTFLPKVAQTAKRRNSIFFRLELNIDKTSLFAEEWQGALSYTGFRKAFESVQPDDRQIVPLFANETTVLQNMKPKGRYNIRVAEKAGVLVRETTLKTLEDDVSIYYSLFEQTAKRDKFSIRSKSYFLQLTQLLYTHNLGKLFIAYHEDEPLAAALITLHDGIASYLYGASSNNKRNVMAPYALHWAAMQWAISQDAHAYDLLAIKPETEKKHPYDGITSFKQRFGGDAVHLMGSWDLVLQPTWYNLFTIIEKMRRHS